jgi:dehydrogenase/reductase SDR family protein 7B
MNYSGKIIWITGASSGIGEAMAYEFAKYKCQIILSSRNDSELLRVKNNCIELGSKAFVYILDLTNPAQITEVTTQVLDKFGRVDVLVNNGGISQRSYIIDSPVDIDRKIMEVDYFGHVAITKALLPSMVANKFGQVIVMSSLSGLFGVPMRSAYCAAKHALVGFFETLRAEHFKDNIKVTIVCPGRIHTNISYHAVTSSGQPHGQMDKGQLNGIPVEKAARKILCAAKRNKKLYVIGGMEVIMVYLKKFLPVIFYKIVTKIDAK